MNILNPNPTSLRRGPGTRLFPALLLPLVTLTLATATLVAPAEAAAQVAPDVARFAAQPVAQDLAQDVAPAGVQAATHAAEDFRWLPWVGCWEPADELAVEGAELLVCVTQDGDGVRIETLVDGESMGQEFLAADGSLQDMSEGGCEGTRQARWSDDGRRVFVLSDLACGPDARRSTSGVFAMGADGFEWIEIQAISTSGDDEPFLSVRRFQAASRATLARHDREAPAADRGLAIETSRRAAARALSGEALVEASRTAGPEVTAALVAEMGHGFDLDGRALRAYRDQGVPPEVLDMMIAMTWPERFQVGIAGGVDQVAMAAPTRDPRAQTRTVRGYDPYSCTGWLGRCGSFDSWLALRYGVYGYGYSPLGFGYRPYGYSSWGWYSGPRYIVVDPTVQPRQRGTMTSEGYRPPSGSGSTQARPANSRGTPQTQATPSRPAASSAPAPRASPPPASSSTPPPRPAQRRTGGGGDTGGGGSGGSEGAFLF